MGVVQESRCASCYRVDSCRVSKFAERTAPWIAEALSREEFDWDTRNAVSRACRGIGNPDGFVGDALEDCVINRKDVGELIDEIVKKKKVSFTILTERCRRYLGPELEDLEE